MADGPYVMHDDLLAYAKQKVNLAKSTVDERRARMDYLRTRLEHWIGEHPDYDLRRIVGSGSVAKGTALKGSSDADVVAYVVSTAVGGPAAQESLLLSWLRDRLIEVYGATKKPEDFVISDHAVGITYSDGLKIDVAPVVYEGLPEWRGHLVTRRGERVLTSVPLHLTFIRTRKKLYGANYAQLIRLVKQWVKEQKRTDGQDSFRCKSFLVELVIAHLADSGKIDFDDLTIALEQVFAFMAGGGLSTRITFADNYAETELPAATYAAIEVFDPVNPLNNVVAGYTTLNRDRLVAAAHDALDALAEAAYSPTKAIAVAAYKRVFGPGFEI